MKSTGKSSSNPKATGKSGHEARKDRQSGTGVTGSPKKGGHGGKFTCGELIDYYSIDDTKQEVKLDQIEI
ncbi:hypothetical protein ACET3Z_012222 [Daucus carota]